MRRFRVEDDFATINSWRRARGLPHLQRAALPPLGLIEPGVAVGFLVTTDTKLCYLDNYVANGDVEYMARDIALDAITNELMVRAQAAGFTHIMAISKHPGIERRAVRLGFESVGAYTLLGRIL